ncbi:MerR family transcriptional regulator [Frankia sp. CNm7]|uniref:MerR family transcriptional regulator n=1 Tax=Frankia nepalensis TaxID=1836974 RepID=A0A937US28_9ACTN|nr:MerR family transcriptional regulator [Frankia nepalensis]MBL7502798.1 MerR family transcriptional regulator [Frankia nepalensis]MBL7514580.1 MerR family transcriptional regulator [Frankia nepalensis]MBL7519408.1 MerR family transcriptional regulator [Frankia nepalensis]MBL7629835.1 MerR family transcriptional regulator [Frankia nepalensis]
MSSRLSAAAAAAAPAALGSGQSRVARPTRRVGHPSADAEADARLTAKVLNIGEVLDRLRVDYPDITLSKIRYLEAEGLVEPARTSANYRKYSAADVARLAYVLHAQRERYLPLRVIKDELAAVDRGELPAAAPPGPRAVPSSPPATGLDVLLGAERVRMSRRELLAASGLDDEALAELERHGLLRAVSGGGYYDADALVVARTVGLLTAHGIEARHLRAARAAADREAGLIEAAVAPLRAPRGGDGDTSLPRDSVDELALLLVRLHAALLRTRLGSGR